MISRSKIEKWFAADMVPGSNRPEIDSLRNGAKAFAFLIVEHSPPSPDQSNAIRHVRDALQSASQSIVLED